VSGQIIKTKVADKAEQFTIGDDHYVGRCVMIEYGSRFCHIFYADTNHKEFVLFRLDYDHGDIFVDPALLRPFPDSKIEEPNK
jgi:hypothetical protein